MKLSEQEKSQINQLATRVEANTGVQVLAVVAGKSDTYPEIPWKAFSLGASLAALGLGVILLFRPAWAPVPYLISVTIILGAGMALALAGIFLRPVSRLFLGEHRAAAETKQYAQTLFLERCLGHTRARTAVLLLASQLERRAAIMADIGIAARIPNAKLDKVSNDMDAALLQGSTAAALAAGLTALQDLLLASGFSAGAGAEDEIVDEFLETEGPKP